ncbi:MAG: hypothetical protein LBQ08_04195 [Holosporaceae bacterium]|jgi:hypothetical protein|nr:hypothetical protein [Holosporaceae bacterium]
MKKLVATILLSAMCLGTVYCMDILDTTHTENPAIAATITKEQLIQARGELIYRDDFWNIRHQCKTAAARAISEDISMSSEESIELLKKAFCGPIELGIRAYVDQEEQRFVDIIDQSLGALREVCSQQDIDFSLILQLGIYESAAESIGYKFLKFKDIQEKKRSIFWLLVADTGYNTSMPSHCIISANQVWQNIKNP